MNEDVTRISSFAAEIAIDEMLESKNIKQLEESYDDAKHAVEAIYYSVKAKIEYDI